MKRKGYDEGQLLDLVKNGAVREAKACKHGERWAFYFRLGGPGSNWLAVRSQRNVHIIDGQVADLVRKAPTLVQPHTHTA